jgi:hypothetical protein
MKEPKQGRPDTPMETRSSPSSKKPVSLGPEIRDRIARDLRMMWDEVVREGVPPHFVDFLDRLEGQSSSNPGAQLEQENPDQTQGEKKEGKDRE